jgi:exodeoxyribonuclease V alpha subunit
MGAATGLAYPRPRQVLGRLARGAPRPGMPGRMVAVTGQSLSPDAPQSLSVLEAVLERITYVNEDTGYTIARVATERTGPDLLTVVGPLLGAQVGESLRLTGRWSSHPRYGRQFQVHSYTTVLPATIQGIRAYLGSGLIKGIGPVMAERMVAHFGTGILAVIEHQPGRLTEVHGLGPSGPRRSPTRGRSRRRSRK